MTAVGVPANLESGPVWTLLEGQIAWYDAESGEAQRWYKRIKVTELVIATSVPPLAGLSVSAWAVSILSSVVVLLEGLQHLFQHQRRWISYRSTCEALKRERLLFQAQAGPYANAARPLAVLAERLDTLLGKENEAWVSFEQQQKEVAKPA